MATSTNKRREAEDAVTKKLEADQAAIRIKLAHNRWNMRKLVDEQTHLKRELAVMGDLIRNLNPPKEKKLRGLKD